MDTSWTDMENGTLRYDYSGYIYGIITPLPDGAFRCELFDCSGFECKNLKRGMTDDLDAAKAFLDGVSREWL